MERLVALMVIGLRPAHRSSDRPACTGPHLGFGPRERTLAPGRNPRGQPRHVQRWALWEGGAPL